MIIAKLVLFASPILVASMLFLANPAAASPVDSGSATVNSASVQAVHGLATLNQVDNSNPILEHLGCNCAYCIRPESPLQGQLPFSNI
ncbi:hypothetical protein NIES267_60650 [Calothrix parasitica NIES-267]|uniref:Secreted protein n=1 Tax=Calothrix parasitica NIES-267 TaxID=1973488 RepID=A0A1Z4LZ95_9CYAN|nr:hypothetical protein NIES267_60650 [Calothrix parasitica NIES-267]